MLLALAGSAVADPYAKRRPEPVRVDWDSRGWTMLGERTVDGRVDRDRIDVGRYEGKFSKLTVVVHDSDLELLDFAIEFADHTKYEPRLAHYFREGQRTRVIDLPGSERVIRYIDIKYRNLAGGGRARVQVWGFKVADASPARVEWDSRGWTLLGERAVNGRIDRDQIDMTERDGRYTKLTLVTLDSDLELMDFRVTFADNEEWRPGLKHYFREGQRTHAIDFPGDKRAIKHIEFRYRNLPGGGNARFQVWGLKAIERPPIRVDWDSRGWTLLGERAVNGRIDHDRIEMNHHDGQYTKLTLVTLDSDLELLDFRVTFGNNEEWKPGLNHYFRENQRTHAIDFPGDKRFIKHIDFKYRNLPGGGAAKFQVWGLKAAAPPPPPVYSWDSRGWQLLGEQTVNGRVDYDRIVVGRDEGRFGKLMIVVLDSDLEILDFDVKFSRGPTWNPAVRQVFRENTRTRAIDLPGDRRIIKYIDVKYANLPGGGRAKIQIWGK